jgi:hypothetical protein
VVLLISSAAACGGDDSSSATTKSPETTAAATTTEAPATTVQITVPATEAPVATDAPVMDDGIEFIDPTTILTPWEGTQLNSVTVATAQSLLDALSTGDAASAPIVAAGAVDAVDAAGSTSTIVFIEFGQELTADLAQSFVEGATGTATDVAEVDANGLPGYAFIDSDGSYGFVAARPTTGVLITSPTEDVLTATIDGLFSANPAL